MNDSLNFNKAAEKIQMKDVLDAAETTGDADINQSLILPQRIYDAAEKGLHTR